MTDLSIRGRILLLVLLAALPALALIASSTLQERDQARLQAREELLRVATLAALQQGQIIEAARHTLAAIAAAIPAVRGDPARCNQYFAEIAGKTPEIYNGIGLLDATGDVICHSMPLPGNINAADRAYYRLAMATKRFAIGEYQVGRITRNPGLNVAYPITDASGNVTAVAIIAFNLRNFNDIAASTPLPRNTAMIVIDRNGTILAHYSDLREQIGEKMRNVTVLGSLLAGARGQFNARDGDGAEQFYAYQAVARNADGSIALRVVLSKPVSEVLAESSRQFFRDLIGISLATLLLLIGAWYGTERFVLRKIKIILGAAKRVYAGDLSARTGMGYTKDELGQIGKAFDDMAASLQGREQELQEVLRNVREQAITDALTGLFNRRYLLGLLPRSLMRAKRDATRIAVIMIDLDHFKRVNDAFGHEAGDVVLREFAALLKSSVRGNDIACRYGGEEFLLVLPDATLETAQRRAQDIRAAAKRLEIKFRRQPLKKITASFGVALFPDHAGDEDSLLSAADEALYEAKGAGRDRVVTSARGSRVHESAQR